MLQWQYFTLTLGAGGIAPEFGESSRPPCRNAPTPRNYPDFNTPLGRLSGSRNVVALEGSNKNRPKAGINAALPLNFVT